MVFTVRVNDEDARLIRAYAKAHGRPISEVLRAFTLERIEDEVDLAAYTLAMEEHEKSPQVSDFDDVWNDING